jgi:small subunit ribosomal protein S4
MGMAQTRAQARQLVSHGHVAVNRKPIDVPSYHLKVGDVVSVRPSSAKRPLFTNVKIAMLKYQPPSWIELEREKMEAKLTKLPGKEEIKPSVQIPLIFEFYSR